MNDKNQWAWSQPGDNYVYGPFDTRERALANALNSGESVVHLGRVEWLDIAAYVDVDLSTVIDTIEERAHDQGGWCAEGAGDMVKVRVRPGTGTDAAEQLALALQAWASEWLMPVSWRVVNGIEVVKLEEQ